MDPETISRSADGIATVLDDIEAGRLDASADQRAYLSGALATLRALLND